MHEFDTSSQGVVIVILCIVGALVLWAIAIVFFGDRSFVSTYRRGLIKGGSRTQIVPSTTSEVWTVHGGPSAFFERRNAITGVNDRTEKPDQMEFLVRTPNGKEWIATVFVTSISAVDPGAKRLIHWVIEGLIDEMKKAGSITEGTTVETAKPEVEYWPSRRVVIDFNTDSQGGVLYYFFNQS